ncbi:DUF362 domain-containing protein [bacterium]|nr:DUF362 domain-containing protein [bacterium]
MIQNRGRREFIRNTAAGAFGLGISQALLAPPVVHSVGNRVKVAIVRNEKAISTRNICDRSQARLMLDRALFDITGKQTTKEAWVSLGLTAGDTVGIKVNCNTWTFLLHTHPELVYALCDSISEIVPQENIIIYERFSSELSRSGYFVKKDASGVRCFGNDDGGGFSQKEQLTTIITDMCTKIINMPTLKTVEGEFEGSLFLKNHIGSLPNSHMTRCHGNAEFCTEVCARPSIKNKTVLAVCDGLRGTYKRGTPWYYGGIIMSRDQIAAECTALRVINEKRALEKLGSLEIPRYVKNADTKYGLGTSDPEKIDVTKITM